MTLIKPLCLSVLILSAANAAASQDDSFPHLTALNRQQFAVHRHNGPDAIVSATGELSVAGKNLPLNPAQKGLVVRYFAAARTLHTDSFATGMAAARTAVPALHSEVT